MRIVFMGTAQFAVPPLEALASSSHEITGVVTQPDRPGGRGQRLRDSPVKAASAALGLGVEQPDGLTHQEFGAYIERHQPDAVIVVAYGKLIPRWLIGSPRYGVVNLHASLLPRYRGAAPVNWAIACGETVTGVCVMQIDEGLDTGPVYGCRKTEIGSEETAPELLIRLSHLGAGLLLETLSAIEAGDARLTAQADEDSSFARRLRREDGYIRWDETAGAIHNKIRAFLPWPSVVVDFRGKRCRLLAARVASSDSPRLDAGQISGDGGVLRVGCGDATVLEVLRLQLENRKAASGGEFLNGFQPGEREHFASLAGAGDIDRP